MATTPPMIGGSDPSVLRSLETPTPSVARTSPPTVSATTGSATSGGTAVARGIAPQVSGDTTTYNQATQVASGTSLTITSATSNEPADVVTVYNTNRAISVSAVNQTVNSYKVNNYAGNEYSNNDVANFLPTFTGTLGASTLNVTGSSILGAVGNITITGGTAGQVLSTNGSGVLSWVSDATTYGNSNVVSLMGAFGSNTITTTGNITGGNIIGIIAAGSNTITTTGNITGGNIIGIIAAGSNTITTTGNITGGNINIPNGYANVTGNATTVGGGATIGVRSILAIDSAFGSNSSADPASAQAVRGRVTGANLTKTRNYVAGVTGQYLVTGTNASEFINTGLLGVVGDQTTTANAAVVAYLDGDGGLTTAGSAYGVSMKNSTPGSGFDYGLDLQFINLNVAGTTTPFKQADIRFNNGVKLVANTAGNISINANVTVGNIIATNIGNIATINLDGNVSNILYGNGVFASAPAGGTYGDSNVVTLLASYGSNTMSTTGNVSVGNIIGNGQALTGLTGANVSGQVGNALVASTVYTNAQPNITSVGTLTSISVTGNANVGNIGATDGVFTGNISGNTNGFAIGYLNIPQVSAANATLALTDAGKHYYSTTAGNLTLTIPLNSSVAFATGTAISIVVQAAGNVLVNAASGVTLYMGGNATFGNRVVSTYGMATLMKVASDTWFINGTGVA